MSEITKGVPFSFTPSRNGAGDGTTHVPKISPNGKEFDGGDYAPDFKSLVTLALSLGGGALAHSAASSAMEYASDREKERDPVWLRVLRSIIPLGIGAAGMYGGYRAGKLMTKESQQKLVPVFLPGQEEEVGSNPEGALQNIRLMPDSGENDKKLKTVSDYYKLYGRNSDPEKPKTLDQYADDAKNYYDWLQKGSYGVMTLSGALGARNAYNALKATPFLGGGLTVPMWSEEQYKRDLATNESLRRVKGNSLDDVNSMIERSTERLKGVEEGTVKPQQEVEWRDRTENAIQGLDDEVETLETGPRGMSDINRDIKNAVDEIGRKDAAISAKKTEMANAEADRRGLIKRFKPEGEKMSPEVFKQFISENKTLTDRINSLRIEIDTLNSERNLLADGLKRMGEERDNVSRKISTAKGERVSLNDELRKGYPNRDEVQSWAAKETARLQAEIAELRESAKNLELYGGPGASKKIAEIQRRITEYEKGIKRINFNMRDFSRGLFPALGLGLGGWGFYELGNHFGRQATSMSEFADAVRKASTQEALEKWYQNYQNKQQNQQE